jgi:triacylglycerol lipase
MESILFIHGFGGDNKQYQSIIKFLKSKGINNFYEFCYSSTIGLHPLKEMAKELADYINKEVKEESISMVAISQGGIIALAYLKYFKNKIIKKLFTICTPYNGSLMANFFNLPGIVDLRPKSRLLVELKDFVRENRDIEIYSIYTPLDLMVVPGWSARPNVGKTKMILAPVHPLAYSWFSTKKFIYKNLLK